MSKTITSILKEAAGDILDDKTLTAIEELFNTAVDEKTQLNVENALTAVDQKHAKKLEAVLEAVDADRAKKLDRVVKVVTENHTKKLKAVVRKYETALNEEAKSCLDTLVGDLSDYLSSYIEELVPAEQIQEAANNKRAANVIENLREALAVDLALSKKKIKGAVVDGKQRLDEATEQVLFLEEQNEKLTKELINTKSRILIEEKSKGLPAEKKKYIMKVLQGKSKQFINENFDYTLRLFDFENNKKEDDLRQEAQKNRKGKDADVIVEENRQSVLPPRRDDPSKDPTNRHFQTLNESYMSELEKW